jgi:hypothetical protein
MRQLIQNGKYMNEILEPFLPELSVVGKNYTHFPQHKVVPAHTPENSTWMLWVAFFMNK